MMAIPGILIGGFLTGFVIKCCINMIWPFQADWLISEVGYCVNTGI